MSKTRLHFPYTGISLDDEGDSGFVSYLREKLPVGFYSQEAWNVLSGVVRLGEKIHTNDFRKNDGRLYFNHNIEIILDELAGFLEKNSQVKDKYDLLGYFLVEVLHDALEDHSDQWRYIFDGLRGILQDEDLLLQLFREVLAVATGGIQYHVRSELIKYFFSQYYDDIMNAAESTTANDKPDLLLQIIRLLNPVDPLFKLDNESEKYANSKGSEEYVRLHSAIELYKHDILLKKGKYKHKSDEVILSDEYIGLGNYIFFTQANAHVKTKDMINNMSDMNRMEEIKPGYVQTRRIKAYILSVKLKHFGMLDELAELNDAFYKHGHTPLTDAEVTSRLEELAVNGLL